MAESLNTVNFQRAALHGDEAEYVDDNIGGCGFQLAGVDVDLEYGKSATLLPMLATKQMRGGEAEVLSNQRRTRKDGVRNLMQRRVCARLA
jgi:hypothetical protein